MTTKLISADEARALRGEHLRTGPDGKDVIVKVATGSPSSWNSEKRSARFVMTSQVKDRYGDIVVTAGLDTTQFDKNPVALLNHRSSSFPIGVWKNVEKVLRGRPARMEGDLVVHETGGPIPEIDQAAWAIEHGVMRASSIGFAPDFETMEMIMGPDGAWTGGLQFNAGELLECSLCGIPANPQALVKEFSADLGLARETVEQILDNYAHDPESGKLVERSAFEALYKVISKTAPREVPADADGVLEAMDPAAALAVCDKFLATRGLISIERERAKSFERLAVQKRKAEQRQRELEVIRLRGLAV